MSTIKNMLLSAGLTSYYWHKFKGFMISRRKNILLSTGLTFGFVFGLKMFVTTTGLTGALTAACYGLFFAGVISIGLLLMDKELRNKLSECVNAIKIFVASLTIGKYKTLKIVDCRNYVANYRIFSETKTVVVTESQSETATISHACQKYLTADISTLECVRWNANTFLNLDCFTSNSAHLETLKLTRFSFDQAHLLVKYYFKNLSALFLSDMDSDRFALLLWFNQTFEIKDTNITMLNIRGLQKYGRALEDYILPALPGSKVRTLSFSYGGCVDPWRFSFEESDPTSDNGHYFNSKKIVDALKKTDISTLELERQGISLENGAPSLANELKETKLTTLNLRRNNITFEDAKAFAKNLKGSQVAKLLLSNISAAQEKEIARILEKNCARAALNSPTSKKGSSQSLLWLSAKVVTDVEIKKAQERGIDIPAELKRVIEATRFFRT